MRPRFARPRSRDEPQHYGSPRRPSKSSRAGSPSVLVNTSRRSPLTAAGCTGRSPARVASRSPADFKVRSAQARGQPNSAHARQHHRRASLLIWCSWSAHIKGWRKPIGHGPRWIKAKSRRRSRSDALTSPHPSIAVSAIRGFFLAPHASSSDACLPTICLRASHALPNAHF